MRPGQLIGRLRLRHRPLWQLYLVGGTVGTLLYWLVPPFKGSGPVINLLGLSGVIAVIVGIRRNRPESRLPWWLFALGFFLYWVADVYTYSYRILFHANIPFPSVGDAVYLAVYPLQMAGLLLLVRRRNPERDRAGLIDSLIMTLGLSLVSYIVLIAPYVHDNTLSLLPKLVSIAYPLGDILLLAATIRLAVDGGTRKPAFYLLVLSIVTLLVTDFAYGVVTLDNAYTHQLLILDVGWIFYYLFWGAAALHPSMRELERPARDRQPRLTWTRLALLTAATLIAPGIEIVKEVRRGDVDLIATITVSAVLFALVVARMAGLIRQRERSIARERILAASAAEIVAATSREQIYDAATSRPSPGSASSRRSSSMSWRPRPGLKTESRGGRSIRAPPGHCSQALVHTAERSGRSRTASELRSGSPPTPPTSSSPSFRCTATGALARCCW